MLKLGERYIWLNNSDWYRCVIEMINEENGIVLQTFGFKENAVGEKLGFNGLKKYLTPLKNQNKPEEIE